MIQASANMAQFELHEFQFHQQTLGLIFDYYHYYIPAVVVFSFYYVHFRFTWQVKYIPQDKYENMNH